MKLKIVSDGTVSGTKVVDEFGEVVENVSFFTLTADADLGIVTAHVELVDVAFEYSGDIEIVEVAGAAPVEHVMIKTGVLPIEEYLDEGRATNIAGS